MGRDEFGKAEVHQELNMARDVNGNRKEFCSKRNAKENTCLLLDGGGNLRTNRKDEVLNVILSFGFLFISFVLELQPPDTNGRVWSKKS